MKRLIVVAGRAFVGAVGLGFVAWLAIAVAVIRVGKEDGAAAADAIVVLGAAQYAGRPSPVLRTRLNHAVLLWQRQLARHLILTGGQAEGDNTSEAEVGRRYVERSGVPDSAVLLEGRGRSTRESLSAVAAIARERGIRRVILVSDPTHLLRAAVLAREGGLEPLTSPARALELGRDWRSVLVESVKVPVAWMGRFAE